MWRLLHVVLEDEPAFTETWHVKVRQGRAAVWHRGRTQTGRNDPTLAGHQQCRPHGGHFTWTALLHPSAPSPQPPVTRWCTQQIFHAPSEPLRAVCDLSLQPALKKERESDDLMRDDNKYTLHAQSSKGTYTHTHTNIHKDGDGQKHHQTQRHKRTQWQTDMNTKTWAPTHTQEPLQDSS